MSRFKVEWFDKSRLEMASRAFSSRAAAVAFALRAERKPGVYASVKALRGGEWRGVSR